MIKLSIEEIDNENDYGSSVLEKEPEVKEPPLYPVSYTHLTLPTILRV